MKRLALVLALVALGACKKAEQQPAQGQTSPDTSRAMMADTSKMMSDTTHMMMSDTAKKAAPATKTAPPTKTAPTKTAPTKRP